MASNVYQVVTFPASAAYVGPTLECENCATLSVQINGTSLDAADGSITFKQSNDGTSFVDVSAATVIPIGTTVTMLTGLEPVCRYYRVTYAKGTNTTGSIVATMFGKANR